MNIEIHDTALEARSKNRFKRLAPEAALDLVQIWCYIKKNVRLEMAD